MSERIFLTYSNATAVPYEGSILGHHVVLNYIDANGEHHTLQGVPQNRFEHNLGKLGAFLQEEVLSDGMRNTDSPFGRLKAVEGVGDKGDISTTQPHTPIAEGDDLSAQWALMRDFGDEVNSTGYEYRPFSQNSNSFAGGALQRARLYGAGSPFPERFDTLPALDPASGATAPRYVPGFEAPLRNPIDTEMPLPFPLDVKTVSPTGNESDRRGSLDGGPQGFDFAAITDPTTSADANARYLGRRTYTVSPPIATQPPPQPPEGDGPLTLMQAYLQYHRRLQASQ